MLFKHHLLTRCHVRIFASGLVRLYQKPSEYVSAVDMSDMSWLGCWADLLQRAQHVPPALSGHRPPDWQDLQRSHTWPGVVDLEGVAAWHAKTNGCIENENKKTTSSQEPHF